MERGKVCRPVATHIVSSRKNLIFEETGPSNGYYIDVCKSRKVERKCARMGWLGSLLGKKINTPFSRSGGIQICFASSILYNAIFAKSMTEMVFCGSVILLYGVFEIFI